MRSRLWVLLAAALLGLLAAAGLVAACGAGAAAGAPAPAAISPSAPLPPVTPLPVVWDMVGQVDRERALGDLRRLTGDAQLCAGADCATITHRLTGSAELHRVTDYLAQELSTLGYAVEFRSWSRSGRSDRNLIARKAGAVAPDEEIYFLAHADGVRPNTTDRFPAADDNGSGAIDLLETARVLSSYTFSRTLVLLITTGEEQGTLGALSYLSQLTPGELGRIQTAIDVDVIGYDGNNDRVMGLWHGGEAPSMAVTQMMSETITAYGLGLQPEFAVGCG